MAILLALMAGVQAHAGRPLLIDDSEPVAPGKLEIELGGRYFNTDHYAWDWPLGLAYGLVPRLELSVGVGGYLATLEEDLETDTVSGFGDLSLGGKWKLLDSEKWFLDQSLAAGVKLPTADRAYGTGETDVSAGWILSKWLADDRLGFHWNTIYSWVGGNDEDGLADLLTYGFATDYQAAKPIQLVAEVYGITPISGGMATAVLANGGIRFFLLPNLVFDAGAGCGLEGPGPNWFATAGFTWTLGFPSKGQLRLAPGRESARLGR
jgi:hypothetical protein